MMPVFTIEVEAAVLAQLTQEARRDDMTIADWLVESALLRLKSRVPSHARQRTRERCRWCLAVREIEARGYCKSCYQSQYRRQYLGVCRECRRRDITMRAQGLCNACYQRAYRARRPGAGRRAAAGAR